MNIPQNEIDERAGTGGTGDAVESIWPLSSVVEREEPVMGNDLERSGQNRVILYTTADGKVSVDVLFARDNFWLTQRTMAELFGVKTPAISRHLKNIFESGELIEGAVLSILETTAAKVTRRIGQVANGQDVGGKN